MRVAKVEEEKGITVPAPYERTIKVLFAPDRRGAAEMTFSHVTIPPGGGSTATPWSCSTSASLLDSQSL
jgi:hypothetical protein